MGWQPEPGSRADGSPHAGVPGGGSAVRDPRLAVFGGDGQRDAPAPSGALALLADEVSGSGRRCPGAAADELIGLLRAWAAVESWAAAAKLGVITELIRRDDTPPGAGSHGDLPDAWTPSLRHELALALSCSAQSAETTAGLAWELQARLPGIGALLNDGTLTYGKARAVIETFRYLSDADAATAEALILDQMAGKTYPQVLRLAEQAALTVDPDLAARRREQAQKRDARVILFREQQGTAGLSGRDLPPDEALAAMASVNARAQQYEDSGAFGDTRMDVLRAYAYLDLLNGVAAEDRVACAEAQDEAAEAAEALAWAEARAARAAGADGTGADSGRDAGECGGDTAASGPRGHGGDVGEPAGDGPDAGGAAGAPSSGPGVNSVGRALQARPPDLVVPLATLLALAERPGEIQGFGMLDPALARDLAAAAAASPHTTVCVTVTSAEGYAIGHGCARPDRSLRARQAAALPNTRSAGFPARLNLTISATALAGLTSHNHASPWALTPRGNPGPPDKTGPPGNAGPTGQTTPTDGYGTWTLTVPGGRRFTVRLDPVPTLGCDHRYETGAYQPGDRLRHLIQVRDGACTFPPCNRHARESDFEHAQPYDKGGWTCACNAGARSRACHRVKQSPGWKLTQPKPGWHEWQTPAGRLYVQEPWHYPA